MKNSRNPVLVLNPFAKSKYQGSRADPWMFPLHLSFFKGRCCGLTKEDHRTCCFKFGGSRFRHTRPLVIVPSYLGQVPLTFPFAD
ncbi:hypothetical protein JTE90_029638 [Oedothorax gibbosus]|uniref:Uncharacterized protein n=1 Tax=Oedothorax gibbosus TaxID=931172 RepID=A0AAV6VEN4_9ARAC|nr:hypothetical protein JTE90_029638 [Oedothorax gibbosus]